MRFHHRIKVYYFYLFLSSWMTKTTQRHIALVFLYDVIIIFVSSETFVILFFDLGHFLLRVDTNRRGLFQ